MPISPVVTGLLENNPSLTLWMNQFQCKLNSQPARFTGGHNERVD